VGVWASSGVLRGAAGLPVGVVPAPLRAAALSPACNCHDGRRGPGRLATWLLRVTRGSPQRLAAAGSHDLLWDAQGAVRSRRCLPGEDGGDVLGGHAMQVQVYLVRGGLTSRRRSSRPPV